MEHIELILASDVPGVGRRGEKVNLALTPTDVHQPEEMATYLAGYSNPQMRADEVSPPVLVDRDQDYFRTSDSDDAFRRVAVKASLQSSIPEVDPKTNLALYKVVDRFVGSFVPTVTELNAVKAFKPRAAALRRCKNALSIDREYDVWDMLTTTGNWNSNNVLALGATQKWNGGSASDPIKDLQTVNELSAMSPVEYWMNLTVANAFVRHDKVKDHFRQFNGDAAIAGAINTLNNAVAKAPTTIDFAIPGVGVVHVVSGRAKNASGVVGFILGSSFVVATHRPPGVPTDAEDIATSYSFRRKGPSGIGFETREFFVQNRGPLGGTMVVCSMADTAVMTANVVGGLITGATA